MQNKCKKKQNQISVLQAIPILKVMTYREHQKRCASNLLLSIKYLIVVFSIFALLSLSTFSSPCKIFPVVHYSDQYTDEYVRLNSKFLAKLCIN